MLLFSTLLNIRQSMTVDDFLRTVVEWNDTSIHPENKVPGVEWREERIARFGSKELSLEFFEDPEQSIVAVRHEKITEDGVVWDSDFILNYRERKLAIQLDRTYSEDALVMDGAFSTPHFITLLIQHGFLPDDAGIPVLRTPIIITDRDLPMFAECFAEDKKCRLPIVLVTKTEEGKDPLSTAWLASRLKGAAHVLVEENVGACRHIRALCNASTEPYGAVRIFYPAGTTRMKKYRFRSQSGDESIRLEKIIRHVIHYWNSQRIDPSYTWQGITNTVLNRQLTSQISQRQAAETARERAENEVEQIYEVFDEDLKQLQKKMEELTRANEALKYENQGLRAKLDASDEIPLLYFGEEEELYQGEIRDMVLSAVFDATNASDRPTRRADVLDDILENNEYLHLSDEKKQRVKTLFKGYKTLTSAMRSELRDLGFEITEEGKHYKLIYHGDQRYIATIGKTPSDHRSGINTSAIISKNML